MLIPFFRRIRRYVFSYSGLKFCPSVSFSAVWPPLYKWTCGHFSSYDCKWLVNTIFFLANHTAATQCVWSCGRGEDTLAEVQSLERRKNEDFEVTLNVASVAVWCQTGRRSSGVSQTAAVLLGFPPHQNHLEGLQRKRRQHPVSGSWLEEDAALMSEVRMGDLLEAVES